MMLKKILILISLLPLFSIYSKTTIKIDGSSTVFPITEAIAEEYREIAPKIRINIGVSGTGGGFKKFTKGETLINNASRKIKKSEVEKCKNNKIGFTEYPIAYDGITIIISKKNNWLTEVTSKELNAIWNKDSKAKLWSDINPKWPKTPIKLLGPGTDSGTFDYFTKAINGKSGNSTNNFMKSEDDNVIVTGVAGNANAMGYLGYAYYVENTRTLKAVKVNGVSPNSKTIQDGSYKPLSRALYLYVNKKLLNENLELQKFLSFYFKNTKLVLKDIGYVPLTDTDYNKYISDIKKL